MPHPHALIGTVRTMELGKVGIWWSGPWRVPDDAAIDVAVEVEGLGYGALWSSGGFDPGFPPLFERLLALTTDLAVASGILSVWATAPDEAAAACESLAQRYPGRFLLGIGASHAAIVGDYSRPFSHVSAYLDALDGNGAAVAKDRRVLAALGPRMLELARDRAAGAHPYFVPVEHTARARQVLGQGPLLAPEVTVVLERDATRARALARRFAAVYLSLPNYTNNLRTLGFTEDDLSGGGSDRLVDAVVAWGTTEAIVARVREHHDAGADHVCVQVVPAPEGSFPLAEYRELAPGLLEA
jgi:probable F420-dependent oxidoreductase